MTYIMIMGIGREKTVSNLVLNIYGNEIICGQNMLIMKNLVEFNFFFQVLEKNYKLHSGYYPMISGFEIDSFKNRITDLSNNEIHCDMLYDPIMESLVQSSLAHFLYLKKTNYDIDQALFHPNYMTFEFLDNLIEKKATVTLSSLQFYEILPSTSSLDIEKLKVKVEELLENRVIKKMVLTFVNKLQVGDDQVAKILEFVNNKRNKTKGMGLLYFIFMDLYLEHLDSFIYDIMKESGINFFWSRCLNSAILGFTDRKSVLEFHKIFKFPIILSAWGLTAKVRTGNKGGRVIRPWGGKLYINADGLLRWERQESIIKM